MTKHAITLISVGDWAELSDGEALDLVERELGHPCDDPEEFEEALFRLGLAA